MISGKSLDDIVRALKMAQDSEGRPAFSVDQVEQLTLAVISQQTLGSQFRPGGIDEKMLKFLVKPSIHHCDNGSYCRYGWQRQCICLCIDCTNAKKADH